MGAEPKELPASDWVSWELSMVTSGRILVGIGISVLSWITWRGKTHREERTLAKDNPDIQRNGITQLMGDLGWKLRPEAVAQIPRRRRFLREGDQGLRSFI